VASNAPRCTQGRECCWVAGKPCIWLNGDLCSLREELGSWDAVHSDPRYLEDPAPTWRKYGIADCGDFVCSSCLLTTKEE
jgi:hypothetical protein